MEVGDGRMEPRSSIKIDFHITGPYISLLMRKANSSQGKGTLTAKEQPGRAKTGQGWSELRRRLLQTNPRPEDCEACEWFIGILREAFGKAQEALGEPLRLIAAVGALAQGRVDVRRLEEEDLELLVVIRNSDHSPYAINDTLTRAAFGRVLTEFGLLLITRVYSVTEWRHMKQAQPIELLPLLGKDVA